MDNGSRPRAPHRTISEVLRVAREREEQETLLGDEEMPCTEDRLGPLHQHHHNPYSGLPVYKTIHRIRRLVLASIDDPYTLEQLQGPRINVSIVRPLVDRLYDPDDCSIVYCLLVNRVQFLREQTVRAHHQTVNLTRATLCELLASRVLRRFHEDNPTRNGLLMLATILVAGFEPFQNCPREILEQSPNYLPWTLARIEGSESSANALEIAIISEAKSFLSSTACQKVVEAVYVGRIVYTPTSWMDLIPDRYKHRGVSLYDPRKTSILNQYRLIVPRTRNIIDVAHFIILLTLYSLTMAYRNYSHFTSYEIVFDIYAIGWCLDEFASTLAHGWHVHTQNLWAFLDLTFMFMFCMYFTVRIHGFAVGSEEEARQALDILACAAPIVFPRIAFNLMPENMLFISLRAMLRDFFVLTLLAGWCFCGFFLAMSWLSQWEAPDPSAEPASPLTISKWMLWIWFGLDGTGITRSVDFHLILGPILMVTFAFLGNTLFLTILVSMLSNTFSTIVGNATAEIQFRRAVLTFEGVKSDAIFLYSPPFNLVAMLVLIPLKFIISPRWFHKCHITAVRILNAPILLLINTYERRYLWKQLHRPGTSSNRSLGGRHRPTSFFHFDQLNAHRDIHSVFGSEPPQTMIDEIEEEDVLDDDILEIGISNNAGSSPAGRPRFRSRRWSSVVARD